MFESLVQTSVYTIVSLVVVGMLVFFINLIREHPSRGVKGLSKSQAQYRVNITKWFLLIGLILLLGGIAWYEFGPKSALLTYEQIRATATYDNRNDLCVSFRYLPQMILDREVAAACLSARSYNPIYRERLTEFWRKWDTSRPHGEPQ